MSLTGVFMQNENKGDDFLSLNQISALETNSSVSETMSSQLTDITDQNRIERLSTLQPEDLKTQADWLAFFKEMKELVPLLDSIPEKQEKYAQNLFGPKILESADREKSFSLKNNLSPGFKSIIPLSQNQKRSLLPALAEKTAKEIDYLNKATKVYLEAIRRIYPSYQMDEAESRRCLLRTKIMWQNLKKDPLFEEGVIQFVHAKNNQDKIEASQKISQAVAQSMKPFFPFDDFKVKTYEDAGLYGLPPSPAYAPWNALNEFYINTHPNAFAYNTAGFVADLAAHEMTHITQFARMKNPEAFKDNPYFGPHFTEILKESQKTYESRYDMEQIRQYLIRQNIHVEENSQADWLSNRCNPMEQEACISGELIGLAVQNWLIQKGLAQNMEETFDFNQSQIYHTPYKNLDQALAFLGEERACLQTRENNKSLNVFSPVEDNIFETRSPRHNDFQK